MQPTASSFAFRSLAASDLPTVHRWLHAPHAVKWFGGERSLQDFSSEYLAYIDGSVPVHAFVVVYQARDIGMVTWERFGDFPELQQLYAVDDPDSANCDVLIGDSAAVHRGLGAELIRTFLAQKVFADPRITSCVIDPFIDNAIAIRAYEKAGFQFLRIAPDDGDGRPLWLMELRREQMSGPPAEPGPFYLRPARDSEKPLAIGIDDDAAAVFNDIGISFNFPPEHPFVRAELERWDEALRESRMIMACSKAGAAVGFCALGYVDERPCLHQISVRRAWARQGIGRLLVERAQRWSLARGELWLTTYDHIPWNAPWYGRLGFAKADPAECGPELEAMLELERSALPFPEHRIAMRYRHG
jgi:GNAT superfamily N-acetyltransferase